jgi:hypothetical protein
MARCQAVLQCCCSRCHRAAAGGRDNADCSKNTPGAGCVACCRACGQVGSVDELQPLGSLVLPACMHLLARRMLVLACKADVCLQPAYKLPAWTCTVIRMTQSSWAPVADITGHAVLTCRAPPNELRCAISPCTWCNQHEEHIRKGGVRHGG